MKNEIFNFFLLGISTAFSKRVPFLIHCLNLIFLLKTSLSRGKITKKLIHPHEGRKCDANVFKSLIMKKNHFSILSLSKKLKVENIFLLTIVPHFSMKNLYVLDLDCILIFFQGKYSCFFVFFIMSSSKMLQNKNFSKLYRRIEYFQFN